MKPQATNGASEMYYYDYGSDVVSKWQPIETAPKDGTRIIVCKIGMTHDTKGHEIGTQEWSNIIFTEDPTVVSVWFACAARYSDINDSGKSFWNDGLDKLVEPTHWMPLPEPPE